MRLSKKPKKEEDRAFNSVKKYLKTDREMFSFMLTYMGMMSIMLDFLSETYGCPLKINDLPERTKYAMSQAIHHYRVLGHMVREEIELGELKVKWMPNEEDAWKAPEKVSERMALIVKILYEQLKEEGAIK